MVVGSNSSTSDRLLCDVVLLSADSFKEILA